jgi:hypothetical protein
VPPGVTGGPFAPYHSSMRTGDKLSSSLWNDLILNMSLICRRRGGFACNSKKEHTRFINLSPKSFTVSDSEALVPKNINNLKGS